MCGVLWPRCLPRRSSPASGASCPCPAPRAPRRSSKQNAHLLRSILTLKYAPTALHAAHASLLQPALSIYHGYAILIFLRHHDCLLPTIGMQLEGMTTLCEPSALRLVAVILVMMTSLDADLTLLNTNQPGLVIHRALAQHYCARRLNQTKHPGYR